MTLNGSWARLNPSVTDVPATATVDFAMLVWQGTLSATVTETVVNNNIPTLQTPDGVTHTIRRDQAEHFKVPFIHVLQM